MTGYVAQMRKLVGHGTIILCGASIICVDENNRILLGKRTDNQKWGYAGGAVEIDKRVEDCAKRELYEEMGLTADEIEFFCVNSGPEAHYIYPNGDEVSNVEIVYLCRKWCGKPKARDGEIDELRFFSCDEIDLSDISPPIRRVVEAFVKKQSAGSRFI